MRVLLLSILLVFCAYGAALAQGKNMPALAEQYYANSEYEKAADVYEKLFNQTNNSSYYYQLINCYINLKQVDKAQKLVKRLIKKNPENSSLHVDMGYIYKSAGNQKEADKEYQKAISELDRNSLYQTNKLADAFLRVAEPLLAIEVYKKARKLLGEPLQYFEEICLLLKQQQATSALFDEMLDVLAIDTRYINFIKTQLLDVADNPAEFELLKTKLLERSQNDAQNTAYTELLIWQYIQQADFDKAFVQASAMDKRFREDGTRIMELAELALSNKKYDAALKAYLYVVLKGENTLHFEEASRAILTTKYQQTIELGYSTAALQQLETEYLTYFTKRGKIPETAALVKDLAHLQAFYLNKLPEAAALLEELIALRGINARLLALCKLDLGDIYLADNQPWDAILIYGQVEKAYKDDPLGQEAKFRNARLSYYQADFDWAKAQLDVLKASTSQLFSNDALNLSLLIADNTGLDTTTDALKLYAAADLLIFQNSFTPAKIKLDSINLLFPKHVLADEILFAKAKIGEKQKNYDTALYYYTAVLNSFATDIWADDALFLAANIYQTKLTDSKKAMELYQRLLTDYPGSLYVVEARKRFRNLRGDVTQ